MKLWIIALVCGAITTLSTSAAELLPNGNFEQKKRDWLYPDYAKKPDPGIIESEIVYGGKAAYRMGVEQDGQNDLYTVFTPDPGKDHQVTLMWKADNIPADDVEVRILRSGGGKVIGWASNPVGSGVNRLASTGGTHDWQEVKFVIAGTEFPAEVTKATLYIKRKNNGSGYLYLDEVSVTPVAAPSAVPGKLADWQYETWRKIPSPGSPDRAVTHTGGGSYCMFAAGQQAATIYQKIPHAAGDGLRLEFYLKADGVPDNDVTFMILANRKDGQNSWVALPPGSGVNVLGSTGGSFDWKKFELNIPANAIPSDATSLLFYVKRQKNDTGKLYLDDLTAAPISPAPLKTVTNLWPGDGSFESNNCFFQLPSDETTAFHGRRSARLDAGETNFTPGYLFRVMRTAVPYVLSGYVKADKPGKLTLNVNSHRYEQIGSGSVELSDKEWRRIVVPLNPQKMVTSCQLQFTKPAGVTVWFDAFQLAEGDNPGLYSPEAPLLIGADRTGEAGEVIFADAKPLTHNARIRNNSDKPVTVDFTAKLDGFGLESKPLAAQKITVNPGDTAVYPLALLETREPGYYVLRLTGSADGKTQNFNLPFAIVQPPAPAAENSFFGLHPNGPTKPENLRRIGVHAVRNMPGWRFIREDNGVYQFADAPVLYSRQYGMQQLNSVRVGLFPSKYKKSGESFVDPEPMREFLRQMVAAWGDSVKDWELENEPDLVFSELFPGDILNSAQKYADYVNAAAPIFKGYQFHASGVSGVDFNNNYPFTRKVLELAGKNIDVISVHPYANSRYIDDNKTDIGPEANEVLRKTNDLRKIIAQYGGKQKIWFGEVGWALDIDEDYLSESALRHGAYLTRLMLIGKAAGVERVMYFLADFCVEKERFYYGIWRNTLPLPAVPAYAAVSRILDGATFDSVIANADVQCFTYLDRDRRPFAALWTADGVGTTAKIPLAADRIEVRDFFNRPVNPKAADGGIEIKLSGYPMFIFLKNGEADKLNSALVRTTYDLPPVGVRWRIINGSAVELTLTNRRTTPLTGEVTLSGADFTDTKRTVALAPGKSVELKFTAGQSLNNHTLEFDAVTNLGNHQEKYRAEFLPCPQETPDFNSSALPGKGRLARMDNRNYLIPNDPNNGFTGPEDLSVESALTYDKDNLYLSVNVCDDDHFQPYQPGRLWSGDSIQLAIDSLADALPNNYSFAPDDYELSFGLTPDGPQKSLDVIYERGRSAKALAEVKLNAFREKNITCYRIAIPWSTLKLAPAKGMVFGLNFIANDNDGYGRKYWMGPTPGIGEGKNPYVYKKFILE